MKRKSESPAPSLREYLEQQSKQELVRLVERLASQFSPVKETLDNILHLQSGDIQRIVRAARRIISDVDEPDWDDGRWGAGSPADFDRLKAHLESLLQTGHADTVLGLGEELIEAGNRATEAYDESGDVSSEVAPCMEIVFEALARSDLSPVEQLRWGFDLESEDEYSLCDAGWNAFWRVERPKEVWNDLASELERRLAQAADEPRVPDDEYDDEEDDEEDDDEEDDDDYDDEGDYEDYDDGATVTEQGGSRDRLADWLVVALRGAGRDAEILPLLEREAEATGSYVRLVDYLIERQTWKEADRWCRRGLAAIPDDGPSYYGDRHRVLRERLRTVAEGTGDLRLAAALWAEEFFRAPGLESFRRLGEAAERAGVRPAVDAAARRYLEMGQRPEPKRASKRGEPAWPLPDPKVPTRPSPPAPMFVPLINIAIAEEEPDDVLKWYDHPSRSKQSQPTYYDPRGGLDERVASAIAGAHPDRAVVIWKRLAEELIDQTKTKYYEIAARHLGGIKATLEREGRRAEWDDYAAALRATHKRKWRFVQILDKIRGKG